MPEQEPHLFLLPDIEPEPKPRDEVWDTLAVVFGEPTTRSNRTLRNKIVASLRDAEATPDQIFERAGRWPLYFPGATLTETALEKHWDRLARPPLRADETRVERTVAREEIRRRLDS